jgi:hypothetical protein
MGIDVANGCRPVKSGVCQNTHGRLAAVRALSSPEPQTKRPNITLQKQSPVKAIARIRWAWAGGASHEIVAGVVHCAF